MKGINNVRDLGVVAGRAILTKNRPDENPELGQVRESLAAINKLGFVTTSAQVGVGLGTEDDNIQRAYMVGFMDARQAESLKLLVGLKTDFLVHAYPYPDEFTDGDKDRQMVVPLTQDLDHSGNKFVAVLNQYTSDYNSFEWTWDNLPEDLGLGRSYTRDTASMKRVKKGGIVHVVLIDMQWRRQRLLFDETLAILQQMKNDENKKTSKKIVASRKKKKNAPKKKKKVASKKKTSKKRNFLN